MYINSISLYHLPYAGIVYLYSPYLHKHPSNIRGLKEVVVRAVQNFFLWPELGLPAISPLTHTVFCIQIHRSIARSTDQIL